jgi:hypothetical protein
MKPISKEKLTLRTELVYGTERIYPFCAISKAICSAFATRCLKVRELECLADVYEIEYSGRKRQELDELGAKYIQE